MSDLIVGAKASLTMRVTDATVRQFAAVIGDTNPIHLDDDYASQSKFGKRVAHGILGAGLISAVLGTQLPGPGSVYLSQTLQFRAPVFIGDTITAAVEITAIREDKPIITLQTHCIREDGTVVIEGEARLLTAS